MKKQSAAVLLTVSLMVLAGCRVAPAGETGAPAPGPDAPSVTPLSSPTPPLETGKPESGPSRPDQDTEKEDEVLLPTPEVMSEKERYQYALDWCEEHREEFSNAALYAMDRSYWFADYTPGGETVPVDERGNVYYYEDTAGTQTPKEAAEVLIAQAAAAGEGITPLDPGEEPLDWEGVKALIARHAAWGKTEAELLGRLESNLSYPALGPDMWVVGYPPDSGVDAKKYVMMKQGNVYRLQNDGAFAEYAARPEVQIRIDFDKALEAYQWFGGMTLPYDMERSVLPPGWEGGAWYAVDYPGISTMLELRTYLKSLFSDEIVDGLLSTDWYREIDGVLYEQPVDGGYTRPADVTATVRRESEIRLVYHLEGAFSYQGELFGPVTLDFPYEKVGDKWVFTEFNWPE